jgi:hypothetical protein
MAAIAIVSGFLATLVGGPSLLQASVHHAAEQSTVSQSKKAAPMESGENTHASE